MLGSWSTDCRTKKDTFGVLSILRFIRNYFHPLLIAGEGVQEAASLPQLLADPHGVLDGPILDGYQEGPGWLKHYYVEGSEKSRVQT